MCLICFLTLEVMEACGLAVALLAKPLLPEEVQLPGPALSTGRDYALISEPWAVLKQGCSSRSFVPVSMVTSLLCQGLIISYFCAQEVYDRHPVTELLETKVLS